MIEIISAAADQTQALGRCLGQCIAQGLAIRLCGDLGSGKTCFVQGLARGLEVPAAYDITSPTYTLINEYPGRLPFYHVDLYRLDGRLDAEQIGLGEILGNAAVVAVEWAERLSDEQWPEAHLKIEFTTRHDHSHRIHIVGSGLEMDNLIREAVKRWEDGFKC